MKTKYHSEQENIRGTISIVSILKSNYQFQVDISNNIRSLFSLINFNIESISVKPDAHLTIT